MARRKASLLPLLALVGGCHLRPVLSLDDAFVADGESVQLTAYGEREPILGLRRDVSGIPVRFFVGQRMVGMESTDDDGTAVCPVSVPPAPTIAASARATIDGRSLAAAATIFTWRRDRPIVVVDIDETIADTEVHSLVFGGVDPSRPLPLAPQTLRALAPDFQILYLTARPRFLLDKTRSWLTTNGFPPGPLWTAPSVRRALDAEAFKRELLAELRERWPNVLIGIGNRAIDTEAYQANRMLALVVGSEDREEFGPDAVCLGDWSAVERLFAANRDLLRNAQRLRAVAAGEIRLASSPRSPQGQVEPVELGIVD